VIDSRESGDSANMVVTEAGDREEWHRFVVDDADASFCHLWNWREVVHGIMGHTPVFRVARDGGTGDVRGVLPLYRVRSRMFGTHLVSVPFMNYGGPCGTPGARELLARWALAEAHRSGAESLTLRTRQAVPGVGTMPSSKVTVVLPLEPHADEMWTGTFDAKFRNKIKRPQRDGMVTRFGVEHLGAFYEVFAHNMRDLGTPVLPRALFERIVAEFPQLVLIGATYLNDRAVCGGFGFIWRDEFEMTWSSSLKELRAAKPNMLLYWDYMRALIDRGVRRFNFGRSTPGSGPHEFKLSWGGKDEVLPWIQWPQVTTGASESRTATTAAALWRHLPIALTNALGPTLARQLPWW